MNSTNVLLRNGTVTSGHVTLHHASHLSILVTTLEQDGDQFAPSSFYLDNGKAADTEKGETCAKSAVRYIAGLL